MNYVYFLKTLQPSLLRKLGYKYVFLLLDDVAWTAKYDATFDFVRFFDIVESQRLRVAYCAIVSTVWAELRPQTPSEPNQIGTFVNMIEFQATAFEITAWECLYELIDTEYPSGWGLDYWFWHYCIKDRGMEDYKMGIIDVMKIVHNPLNF